MNDLLTWWHSEFTKEEQDFIVAKYQPMVIGSRDYQSENSVSKLIRPDGSLGMVGSLAALATWFMSPKENLPLARKILAKGLERGEAEEGPILDRHFTYSRMIEIFYKDRTRDPDALELAIDACKQQIALSRDAAEQFLREYPAQPLPHHTGYHQLAIILEKEKNYSDAILLCQKALAAGWAGDWEKRIAGCTRKMDK